MEIAIYALGFAVGFLGSLAWRQRAKIRALQGHAWDLEKRIEELRTRVSRQGAVIVGLVNRLNEQDKQPKLRRRG